MQCCYCRAPHDVAGLLRVVVVGTVETAPICWDREACLGRRFRKVRLIVNRGRLMLAYGEGEYGVPLPKGEYDAPVVAICVGPFS